VLLIDGEMPAQALRERLEQVAAAEGATPAPLDITAGALIDRGIGDLASPTGGPRWPFCLLLVAGSCSKIPLGSGRRERSPHVVALD
jgi:hypothetical protein